MTDKLPANLLALFAPRPPLRYIPPTDRAPDDIKKSTISGVGQYVDELQKYGEEVPYNATESWLQRKARLKAEKKERLEKHLTEGVKSCKELCLYSTYILLCSVCTNSVVQTIQMRIPRSEATRSRRFLCLGSATM